MVDFQIDLAGLDLGDLDARLDEVLEAGLDRAAEIGLQSKLREISETTKRSIPTRGQVKAAAKQLRSNKPVRVKGGKKKNIGQADPKASAKDNEAAWKRKGDWASGQRIEKPSRFVREIVTIGDAANYEEHLANLPNGALGVNRSNPAAQKARDKTEQQLEAVLEQEIRNVSDF